MSARVIVGRRGMAVAVAAAWLAGSAYVAWDLRTPGDWGLPLAVVVACAACLALSSWPHARAARWLQAGLWTALLCLALVPPLYTAIASAANAWYPDRFMCDAGGRMVRCGMIGIEALAVPLAVLAFALVCRIWWRDAAVERIATVIALLIAAAWLASSAM